ncbi:MAG TPA: trypsin-like peptidase domain-containing protein [Anaerolineaceae bacterium]|nr:trypsin-like peptidase domain-containing protein [Anaerolineaceae bacterium]
MNMRNRIAYLVIVVLVAGAAALGGAVAGGYGVYTYLRQNKAAATPLPVITNQPAPAQLPQQTGDVESNITQAVASVSPAVVTVVATIPGQMTFFGQSADSQVSGSGAIISADGYILTNNHVVEGANDVSVILADGQKLTAKVVGTDQFADLAVLKADGEMPGVATLGNSDALKPGEIVIAMGSPLGDFVNTVTMGVVSATGRNIDTGSGYMLEGMIQTDAAINHGNSGGPLINLAGQVIGINTLIVRGDNSGDVAEGLGFAIPANIVSVVANQIIEKGYVARPYLGIRWNWITPDIAQMYNLPVEWGVYVGYVESGSPAAQAGLQEQDIITQIGDITLDENHPYTNALFNYSAGETVDLTVWRGNQPLTVSVKLGERNTP